MTGNVTKDIMIEQLIKAHPQAVGFLIAQGLPCVVCGEPFWGTLEELARQKGWENERIAELIQGLNAVL
ncbi:MAG: DUF1858 domain-containing protein [bacterium]